MAATEPARPATVGVLGPLQLTVDGEPVEVRGPKRRAVLALLALAEGRIVTVDYLVDALWPSEVPESGRQALHTNVSRLRRHLGPAAALLQTRSDGYRLALDDGPDLASARTLLARSRAALPADPATAVEEARRARALWRGPVLADLTDVAPIAAAVEECGLLHREVTDALVTSAIAAGKADRFLALAGESAAADPLREPAVLLLMRAHAATGAAAEALRVGREYRQRLADETGLDPSPALGDLERDVAGGAAGPAVRSDAVAPVAPAAPASTRLIGREAEVAALHRLLADERLVTLVGPGGVGKTRVAMEVARRSGHVPAVRLAPVSDPAAVPHALAAALGMNVVHGDVLAACLAVLGDRSGLLVIDNCEHLIDAVRATVDAVLSACQNLTVLATSRAPIGLAAEYTSRLPPLPLPGPSQDPALVPSVAVFLERAHRVRPGPPPTAEELAVVAEIVRRLDGMPLAIELAAGRLSTFSLGDLRDRLHRSLDLLGGPHPGDHRHRTLRATVEWSYELLPEGERRLFRYLSVFADGLDLGAAEQLAAELAPGADPGSLLARLVDASMLEVDFAGGTRYRMLEALRAYGIDRLRATGEDGAADEVLLRWAVALTAWIGDAFGGEREPEADAVLRRELANLRAAWRVARRRDALDAAAAVVGPLIDAVSYRDLVELRGWAGELAEDPALPAHPRATAVLGVAAEAAYQSGDHPLAERLARDGLDRASGASSDSWRCLLALSVVELARGEFEQVVRDALAAEEVMPHPRDSLGIAALARLYAGDVAGARTLNDRGVAAANSPTLRSWGAYVAGEIESTAGDDDRAEQQYLRAIDLARTSGATFLVGVASVGLLSVRSGAGRVREALDGFREVIDYFARTGNWTHLWVTLRNLADLLRRLGDHEPAALLDAAAARAPDAPVDDRASQAGWSVRAADPPVPGRDAVLEIARSAIARNLDAHAGASTVVPPRGGR